MHTIDEFIVPEDRSQVIEWAIRRLNGEAAPENYKCRLLKCDGTTRVPVFLDAGLILYRGHPANMGTIREMTGQDRE